MKKRKKIEEEEKKTTFFEEKSVVVCKSEGSKLQKQPTADCKSKCNQ